ncbi:transcriptional regulator [Paeniglutamicibacter antarcticus]|uniref:Transcriptional regulator n=1 Tax=Paeniglutamicibacter antarcticus TaxID=494023 RepID=A0ABP9TMM6_9MICC
MSERKPSRGHPRHLLDDALKTPVRFSAMAALRNELEIDFATLAELVEAGDSALSKAVALLKEAGYISVRKGYVANRPRTWIRATPAGMKALATHSAALQAIATGVDPGEPTH